MDKSHQAAEAIANYLFRDGNGTSADRLLLIVEDYPGKASVSDAQYLGGWSRAAVRDAVSRILQSDSALDAQQG